jgi:hypothetical protein
MGVQEILASVASDGTGLAVLSREPRAGQHAKRSFLSFLIVAKEQRKRICASMALFSFSPIIVIVATPVRFVMGSLAILTRERIDFDCNAISWLTFRKNAAVSTPGEAL